MKIDIGDRVYFLGFGPGVEVISIDENSNSWIGRDVDHLYPLDEVKKYWKYKQNEET